MTGLPRFSDRPKHQLVRDPDAFAVLAICLIPDAPNIPHGVEIMVNAARANTSNLNFAAMRHKMT
jgi:hypothetical protein